MQEFINVLMRLPVEWFVFVGSIIEEIISPIPSFVVLIPAGASMAAQHYHIFYGFILAMLAATGRVIGGIVLYWIANASRGWLFTKRKQIFGITPKDVERFRNHFSGKQEWWALFTMWAVPILPGAPLSLGSGLIRLPMWVFITATFAGSVINASCYIYIGYFGLKALFALHLMEFVGEILVIILFMAACIWLWRHSQKGNGYKR
jgi:membrane protein DedA with SNARE-associated domain